jgi:hypothetical protein
MPATLASAANISARLQSAASICELFQATAAKYAAQIEALYACEH